MNRQDSRRVHRLLRLWLLVAVLAASCGPKTPPTTVPAPRPVPVPSASAPAPTATQPPTAAAPAKAAEPSAAATAPATRPESSQSEAVSQLVSELDRIFKAPAFDRMLWGIQIQSLSTGEVLYQLNPTKLMMPASNMKIVTLATAAERLGWDYTFETKVFTRGQVDRGVLKGDLIVVGSGDPTINARSGNLTGVFEEWAARLRDLGITTISGRVIADDRSFDETSLGAGWSWDYLVYDYATPVTALQYNENVATLVAHPGATAGMPAAVSLRPEGTGLVVRNHLVTSAPGSRPDLELRRMAGSDTLEITGTIPERGADVVRVLSVDNPAAFFARALKSVLVQNGIAVRGDAVAARSLQAPPDVTLMVPVFSRRSAPLAEIAKVLMKVSQNLYAETLVRTLGLQNGAGTAEAGEKVVSEVLEQWGIAPESHVLVDGSGLSRYNYVTPEMLVQILRRVYNDPRHRQPFLDALAVAGVEGGTLARRMKGTRAAGNVHAKTGSIANVRALSGFLQTADGEPVVFSILANNFTQPQATIDATTDLALERLANFTRRTRGSYGSTFQEGSLATTASQAKARGVASVTVSVHLDRPADEDLDRVLATQSVVIATPETRPPIVEAGPDFILTWHVARLERVLSPPRSSPTDCRTGLSPHFALAPGQVAFAVVGGSATIDGIQVTMKSLDPEPVVDSGHRYLFIGGVCPDGRLLLPFGADGVTTLSPDGSMAAELGPYSFSFQRQLLALKNIGALEKRLRGPK